MEQEKHKSGENDSEMSGSPQKSGKSSPKSAKNKHNKSKDTKPQQNQPNQVIVHEVQVIGPEDNPKRSAFGLKRDHLPYVDYTRYCEEVKDKIAQVQMLEMAEFKTYDFKEYIKIIMPYLDITPEEEIFAKPDKDFRQYTELIRKIIPPQFFGPLQKFWYPAFTITQHKDQEFVYFMAKFLRTSADPTKIGRILARMVFKDTLKSSSAKSPYVKAMSACTYEKKKSIKWAILNQDRQFVLIGVKDQKLVNEADGLVKEIIRTKTGDGISVIGLNGKPICKNLVLQDPQHILLWIRVVNDQIPVFNFMSSIVAPYPDQVYQTIYTAVTHSDFVFLRSLLKMVEPDDPQALILIRTLFNIFCYAGKVNQFYITLAISFFSSNPDITAPSHIKNLFKLLLLINGDDYISFLKKLVSYIDSKNINVDNKDNVDASINLMNTVIKLICSSSDFLPLQARHLLSVIKEIAALFHNTTGSIFDVISETFLLGAVSDFILNSEMYLKVNIANRNTIKPLLLQLRKIFRLGTLDRHLSVMNDRLEKHIFPRLCEFIMASSDFPGIEMPDYSFDDLSKVARELDVVFTAITKLGKNLPKVLQETAREPEIPECGYAFLVLVSRLFVHYGDEEYSRQRQTKLVATEAVVDKDGTIRRLVPITPDMKLKPGVKMYKRVMRKQENMIINEVVKPAGEARTSPRVLKKIRNASPEKKPAYVVKVEKQSKKNDLYNKMYATEV